MLAFVPDVIRPLLDALDPQVIVEIGSEYGKTTRHLVDHARFRGGIVHAIDPAPLFDAAAWQAELSPTLVVHQKTSLEALTSVPRFDAVLIDGDHNWYTVFHELSLIEKLARDRGHALPLVLLHDVAWPYGRRDLYYDVESIPVAHRQPCARGGISPTAAELLPRGGFNAHLMHAVLEGGRHNGVLTAVEDWVEASPAAVDLIIIPAVFGLAIAIPKELSARVPALSRIASAWAVPEVSRFIERLEMARIAMLTGAR